MAGGDSSGQLRQLTKDIEWKGLQLCLKHERIRENFEILDKLGEGGAGVVFKVKHKIDNHHYALKIIPCLEDEDDNKLKREVEVLARMKHECIVGYNTSWTVNCRESLKSIVIETESEDEEESDDEAVESGEYICILMEFCDQTLNDFIEKGQLIQNPDELDRIFREILAGITYIHDQDVLHRDIKPNNIFLDKMGHVKIGDFGFARQSDKLEQCNGNSEGFLKRQNSLTDNLGTHLYTSPEILIGCKNYDKKVDAYSLGIVLFEMCYPMDSKMERANVLTNLRLEDIIFPDNFRPPLEFMKDIIFGLLQHIPEERFTVQDALEKWQVWADEDDDSRRTRHGSGDKRRSTSLDHSPLLGVHDHVSIGNIYWQRKGKGMSNRSKSKYKSLCFHVTDDICMTAYMPSKIIEPFLAEFVTQLDNPFGLPEAFPIKKRFLWSSRYYRSHIFRLAKPSQSDLKVLQIDDRDIDINNATFYVYVRLSRLLQKVQTMKIEIGNNNETYYVLDTILPNSNLGAPVLTEDDDGNFKLCGIVISHYYISAVKVGTIMASMRQLCENVDEPLPATLRKQLFSHTSYMKCHDNLLHYCLQKKTDDEDHRHKINKLELENKELRDQIRTLSGCLSVSYLEI